MSGRYEEFLERVAACIEANTEEKLSIIFQNCTENYLTDLKLDEDRRKNKFARRRNLAIWTGKCRFGSWNYMKQIFFIFYKICGKIKRKRKNISKSWCYGWHPACNIILVIPEKGERMEVTIIFKIAAVGILVSILSQVFETQWQG